MAYGVIYKITNLLNGKPYVGKTKRPIEVRISEHRYGNKQCIDKAIKTYGWKNFYVEVLEECENLEQLNEREIFWIAYFNSKVPNGYNLTDGGQGHTGYSPSEDTRAKMSMSHKNPSAEIRAKLSEQRKGVPKSAEHCTHISMAKRSNSSFKNLIIEMNKRNLSYISLAKFLRLTPQTISCKMRGKTKFTARDIAKLVELFGKPAEYLMQRDD